LQGDTRDIYDISWILSNLSIFIK